MKKFEYKKVRFNHLTEEHYHSLDVDKLNGQGSEGWELISVMGGECIFKREIETDD